VSTRTFVAARVAAVFLLAVATTADASSSQSGSARAQVAAVRLSLDAYRSDDGGGRYPSTLAELVEHQYLKDSQLVDPWGRPLIYRPTLGTDAGYVLYSVGRNGVDESSQGDDISGWSPPQTRSVLPILGLGLALSVLAVVVRRLRARGSAI
jgi:hypothetical protein